MKTPKVTIHEVHSDANLRVLCGQLRERASRALVVSPPEYATSIKELDERVARDYKPHAREVLGDPKNLLLSFGGLYVLATATIDAFEEPKVWHLSMSCATSSGPGRVRDHIVHRVCAAFFGGPCTEGPPEGALTMVRHFRAPWMPN